MKFTSILTVVFLITGCASHGVMVSDQQLQQIKRGITTEDEVIATLGRPTTVTSVNGQRILIYSGAYAQARPASFIPVIGPLVGGSDVRASSVVLRIQNGVVSDISSSQTATGGGTGLAAGPSITPVPDQPRQER